MTRVPRLGGSPCCQGRRHLTGLCSARRVHLARDDESIASLTKNGPHNAARPSNRSAAQRQVAGRYFFRMVVFAPLQNHCWIGAPVQAPTAGQPGSYMKSSGLAAPVSCVASVPVAETLMPAAVTTGGAEFAEPLSEQPASPVDVGIAPLVW